MKLDPYRDAPRVPAEGPLDPIALIGAAPGAPVEIEIGPGRGGFIFERLEARPDVVLLGLEIRRKWATVVDRRLAARGLSGRARVFAEDARLVLPRFPAASAAGLFVHFPDPWWKQRHARRRVVDASLFAEAARLLQPGAPLFVQTDVEARAADFERTAAQVAELAGAGVEGPRVPGNPFHARSPRERRAEEDGLPVYRLLWRKRG